MSAKKYVTIDDVNNSMPEGSKLKAIEFVYKLNKRGLKQRYVRCVCECGSDSEMSVDSSTTHKSCGCIRKDLFNKMATKYLPVVPKILKCYHCMIDRCYKPSCKIYYRYGGRGVTVCKEWVESYQSFLNWALANGYKDGLQLDKDIKGDGYLYSPDTCCWITNLENQRHKSNTVRHEYNGDLLTISEISEQTGISSSKIKGRLKTKGTTVSDAIFLINNNINRRYEK